jgi:predicted ABC-type transport system involved in lysophospholipase L1 biosynthesis ATPase subunit
LHSRLGATVVIVTHDMHVARSCERMVTLRDGQIVEDVRQ